MKLEALLDITKSTDYSHMTAGDYDLSSVYGWGERVAKEVGMTPKLSLHDLIQVNGGTVHYIDIATFRRFEPQNVFENSIYVHKEREFDIILPMYAGIMENRYTMAHELGHYVLHAKKGKCFARRQGTDAIEQEADCFALGFLMPRQEFKQEYEKYKGAINELSIVFFLPVNIKKSRIASLGLS